MRVLAFVYKKHKYYTIYKYCTRSIKFSYTTSISIDQTSTRSIYRNRDSVLAILYCEVVGGERCTADTSRRKSFKSDHTCQVGTKAANTYQGGGTNLE